MESVNFRCGEVLVDISNRRFTRGGAEVTLEPKVFAAIVQLVSKAGTLVTRNQLLDAIWGHRYVSASTVNRLIVLARRAFGDDPEEPRFIRTVHGVGYRYVGPIESAEAAGPQRLAPFAPPAAARLPARLDSLIGRELALGGLSVLLEPNRAVTVLGPGGIGKTQFALEWARRLTGQFPDGVWFFDLAPMRQGEEWLHALAAALFVSGESRSQLLDRLCAILQGRRALFLLDNCERVAGVVGGIVREMLQGTDGLKVLATSQAPLNFKGEQLLRLPPLDVPELPDEQAPDLQALSLTPAVTMLMARVHASQPGFALTAANAHAIARICRRLDGLPLALELAAARFSLLSPEQVLERLDQRFRFLKSDMTGIDPRHRTLVALLDWGYALLSGDERRLLNWLSVFIQGWTVDSAIGLAEPLGVDAETVVELLTGLTNKSLVSTAAHLAPPRYYLLETVRDYALQQLRLTAEEPAARAAQLAVVVRLARATHADMVGGRMPERIESMVAEKGNIVAALEYALASGALDSALAIVGDLTVYIKASGLNELGVICERVIAATGSIASADRARALLCLGVVVLHRQAGREPAHFILLEAARLARLQADAWTEAYAAGYCAVALANVSAVAEAEAEVRVVQQIAEQLRNPLLLSLAGLARGWLHLARGENASAIEVLRAVQLLGEDPHQQHFIGMYIGLAFYGLGNVPAAAAGWLDAMSRAARVGHVRGIAGSVEGCAYLAEKQGDVDRAARFLGVAAGIRERTGVPLFNFWRPYHDAAAASLREQLGRTPYEVALQSARRLRDEDVFDEVTALLSQYASAATEAMA